MIKDSGKIEGLPTIVLRLKTTKKSKIEDHKQTVRFTAKNQHCEKAAFVEIRA